MRNLIDLIEHAIARKGDWEYDDALIGAVSNFIFTHNWVAIGTLAVGDKSYTIAKHKNVPSYVVGIMHPVRDKGRENSRDGMEEFGMVLHLEMSPVKNFSLAKNLYNVDNIGVKEGARGLGIAKALYLWLVNTHGITILGDIEQYFGARRLWASLSKSLDATVDIVDYYEQTFIEKGAVLHHGQYDEDFDQRVWSYGEDKMHIRLILRALTDVS